MKKYLTGQFKNRIIKLEADIEEYKEIVKKQQIELDAALQREIEYEKRYDEMLIQKNNKIYKLEQTIREKSGIIKGEGL
jgi:predicted RNase H-like nuclease (RuvC/YqgF family)